MTNPTDLVGRSLALLTRGIGADGEEEVWLQTGTLIRVDGQYVLERDPDRSLIGLEDDWLDRIEPVPETIRKTFREAELLLLVNDGMYPEDADLVAPAPAGMAVG